MLRHDFSMAEGKADCAVGDLLIAALDLAVTDTKDPGLSNLQDDEVQLRRHVVDPSFWLAKNLRQVRPRRACRPSASAHSAIQSGLFASSPPAATASPRSIVPKENKRGADVAGHAVRVVFKS